MDETRYADWLRAELTRRGLSARRFGSMLSPDKPEQGRRQVTRWLGGQHQPSEESLENVAAALDLERADIPVKGDGRNEPPPFTQAENELLTDLFRRWLDREVYGNGPRQRKVRV